MSDASKASIPPRLSLFAGLAVLVGAGAVWHAVSNGPSLPQECRASAAALERAKPFAKGELAALIVPGSPKSLPELSFNDPVGRPTALSSLKGKTVLVNLWATWCVPCREEMPALDKLQAELGGKDFEVVAINVDTRNPDKPKAWLQENGIRNLGYYADPTGKLLQVLQKSGHLVGLPTSLLVDSEGCEIALLKGPAEWASPDALALMRASLGRS
jgi:thiol-disulfide isomerase/thioredoxin